MVIRIGYRRSHELLNLHNPYSNYLNIPPQIPYSLTSLNSSNLTELSFLCSVSRRPFSLLSLFSKKPEEKSKNVGEKLSLFFKGAVGLSQKVETSGSTEARNDSENAELKEKLRKLEEEIRILNKNMGEIEKVESLNPPPKESSLIVGREVSVPKRGLWALFADEKALPAADTKKKSVSSDKKKKENVKVMDASYYGNEDPKVHKELSVDMQLFAQHLFTEGYLKGANFIPKDKFDVTSFEVSYAREYLKFAAVKFGDDHPRIAKWLSASDLKKVALFGCPSLGYKSIYAAKNMRKFFKIDEPKVCQNCKLKESCEHANNNPKKPSKSLRTSDVARVLVMYALESHPRVLVVPEEVKSSVSRLLKELIKLSQNAS